MSGPENGSRESSAAPAATPSSPRHFDAIIVGAGFAGLYMLHRLREQGLSARVFEMGSDIGGTWFWNRYPGARCDVESMAYSYQFSEELQQEWEWSERYASQPEILRYIHHVADRFDLRRDIQLETRVESATYDEGTRRWTIETADGERVSARFCIMATGCLSSTNMPQLEGLGDFGGPSYHTGNWPHEGVDFRGRRVAVIGTGSSAIQAIPHIAEQAEHLYVFQRTPNYSVPARNAPLDPATRERVKAEYRAFRRRHAQAPFGIDFEANESSALEVSDEERRREYEARWQKGGLGFVASFSDLIFDRDSNETAAEFVRQKIREIVDDPEVAEALCPEQTLGCKRLCLDTGYYETFNRDNVTLIDLRRSPIERVTGSGVRAAGKDYEVDCLVFATGFDAMTGALNRIDIRGRAGMSLKEKWAEGPRTLLGLATAGFPNLFTITGPGSPSVLSNMLPSIEQHVEWIGDCIDYMDERGFAAIEPSPEAEEEWVAHVNEVVAPTLFPTCNSWYLGSNIPGKPRVFLPYIGGFPTYVAKCDEVAERGYEGFRLTPDRMVEKRETHRVGR